MSMDLDMSTDLDIFVTREVQRTAVNEALQTMGALFTVDFEPHSVADDDVTFSVTLGDRTIPIGSIYWRYESGPPPEPPKGVARAIVGRFSLSVDWDERSKDQELLLGAVAEALAQVGSGVVTHSESRRRAKPNLMGLQAWQQRLERSAERERSSRRPGESAAAAEERRNLEALETNLRHLDLDQLRPLLEARVQAVLRGSPVSGLANVLPAEAKVLEVVLHPCFVAKAIEVAKGLASGMPAVVVHEHVEAAASQSGIHALPYARFLASAGLLHPEDRMDLATRARNSEIAEWLKTSK